MLELILTKKNLTKKTMKIEYLMHKRRVPEGIQEKQKIYSMNKKRKKMRIYKYRCSKNKKKGK